MKGTILPTIPLKEQAPLLKDISKRCAVNRWKLNEIEVKGSRRNRLLQY
jgi:hypothetical protein